MKKATFIIAVITTLILNFSNAIYAQPVKGDWLAEAGIGNITLSDNRSSPQTDSKLFYMHLYPRIGYFFTDHFVLGTSLDVTYQNGKFNYTNNDYSQVTKTTGSSISISPFARYYINLKNIKTRFYIQLSGGYGTTIFQKSVMNASDAHGIYQNTSTYSPKKNTNINGTGLIGFEHYFTDHVAFNITLGYSYAKYKQGYEYTSSNNGYSTVGMEYTSKSTSQNVVWGVGFTFIIPGKKKA
jgi:hypothetical protein